MANDLSFDSMRPSPLADNYPGHTTSNKRGRFFGSRRDRTTWLVRRRMPWIIEMKERGAHQIVAGTILYGLEGSSTTSDDLCRSLELGQGRVRRFSSDGGSHHFSDACRGIRRR